MTSRVNDAYADPRFNSKVDKELGFFTKNILAAPVMRPGDASVIGVVQVINKCDRGSDDFVDFEEEDAAMIEAFCAQIGFAVEQSQNSKVTQSKLEKSAKTLEGLRSKMHDAQAEKASIVKDLDGKRTTLDIARRIGGAQKLDDLFNTVAHEIRSILGVDRVTLFVVDHVKGIIWSQVAEGTCERFTIRLGEGIAGTVAQRGKPVVIHDAYSNPLFNPAWDKKSGYTTNNLLCLPCIDVDDTVVGVIQAINKLDGEFNEEDKVLLSSIAAQIGPLLRQMVLRGHVAADLSTTKAELQSLSTQLEILQESLEKEQRKNETIRHSKSRASCSP